MNSNQIFLVINLIWTLSYPINAQTCPSCPAGWSTINGQPQSCYRLSLTHETWFVQQPRCQTFCPGAADQAVFIQESEYNAVHPWIFSQTSDPVWCGLRNENGNYSPFQHQWLLGSFNTYNYHPNNDIRRCILFTTDIHLWKSSWCCCSSLPAVCEMACPPVCPLQSAWPGTIFTYSNQIVGGVAPGNGSVTIECENDHLFDDGTSSARKATCDCTGVWSTEISSRCQPVCQIPPALGTDVSSSSLAYAGNLGSSIKASVGTVTATCETGYTWADLTNDQKTFTCLAASTWQTVENCVKACAPLVTTDDGQELSYNTTILSAGAGNGLYTHGTNATVTCDTANEWILRNWTANYVHVCDHGDWTPPTLPECVLTCDEFVAPYSELGEKTKTWDIVYTDSHESRVRPNGTATVQCSKTKFTWAHDATAQHFVLTCNSSGLWHPSATPGCEGDDTDDCGSAPCQNQAQCTDNGSNFTCDCIAPFTGVICDTAVTACDEILDSNQMAQRKAMLASQTMSSVSILVMLSAILVIFFVLLEFSLSRLYHLLQELSLLTAHALVLPARSKTLFDLGAFCDPQASPDYDPPALSDLQCRVVAALLHYLFTVHFLTTLLESLHNYGLYTMSHVYKPILNRAQLLVVALGVPIIPVAFTCALFWTEYTTEDTCWLNFDSANMYIELCPMIVMSAVAVIVSEATTMVPYPEHCKADQILRTSAMTNSKGGIALPGLSLFAWLFGAQAVYATNLSLYSTASVLNIILGVCILVFHTLGNARARTIIFKVFCCCCAFSPTLSKKKWEPKYGIEEGMMADNKELEGAAADANQIGNGDDEDENMDLEAGDEISNSRRTRLVLGGTDN